MTIGEIKCLSEQLFNFVMCFSSSSFLNSILTSGCKLIGTRRPFWCVGVNSLWNVDFTECFKDLRTRVMGSGKSKEICLLIGH